MRLVFCGTPWFAVPTLEALLEAGHSVDLVLSQPDRPSGRGMAVQISPVKQLAIERGLTVSQPEKLRDNAELKQLLIQIAPDAIVVVAYGRLIPPWMLTLPRHGNLNMHGSLLPKYRGAAPIQWAVASGETETGITSMRLDEGLDTGDTLLQQRVSIAPTQTAVELAPVLATIGAELIVRTLAGLEAGTLRATPQDAREATLAPILTRDDGRIDWTRPATQTYNRWRGFQPWPGAFTVFRGKKLSVHSMRAVPRDSTTAVPGTMARSGNHLFVACGVATRLELLELQLEGKRRMPVADFLNGVSIATGERLG